MASSAGKKTVIGRRTLLDDLTAGLLTLIQEDGYQVGDRLPSMPALAERFGVATPTLREAARRLEAAGTISFRHGSGLFVTGDSRRLVIANPARNELGDKAVLDVLDARLLIEPELSGRAARNSDQADLAAIEAELDAAWQAIQDRDATAINRHNMAFHVQVARAAGNQILAESLQSVVELYEPQQSAIGRIYADVERDHAEHVEIFRTIAAGEAGRATELMRGHLEEIIAVVRARKS